MKALPQSAYYAIGIIMMKGVSLLMIPYITRKLSLAEYGSLESLVLLADIGTILFSFGLVDAMYRYVGTAHGKEKKRLISNCFTLSFLFSAFGALLLAVSMTQLIDFLPVKFEPYQLILLAIPILIDGLISIPLTLMRMQAMAKKFCQLNVAKALIQALITFITLELGFGIDGVIVAATVSSILLALALIRYQWDQMGNFGYLNDSAMLLKFCVPVLIGSTSVYMITGLDRWLLAQYVGVEQLAIYAIAVKFALLLALILQPYALWWFPNRIATLQQNEGEKKCADLALIGVNAGIVIALGMALTVPSLLMLLLPESYHAAGGITVALLAINAIKNAGDYMNLGCFSGNSSQSQMWIHIGCAVFAIAGYFWFVPQYGLWAVVTILGSVYLLRLMLLYVVSQSIQPLNYAHRTWILSILTSVSAWYLHAWVSQPLSPVLTLINGLLFGVATIILLIALRVIPVHEFILSKVKSLRNQHARTS